MHLQVVFLDLIPWWDKKVFSSSFCDTPKIFSLVCISLSFGRRYLKTQRSSSKNWRPILEESLIFSRMVIWELTKYGWEHSLLKVCWSYIIIPYELVADFYMFAHSSVGTVGCCRVQRKILQIQIFCRKSWGDWKQKEGNSMSGFIYHSFVFY